METTTASNKRTTETLSADVTEKIFFLAAGFVLVVFGALWWSNSEPNIFLFSKKLTLDPVGVLLAVIFCTANIRLWRILTSHILGLNIKGEPKNIQGEKRRITGEFLFAVLLKISLLGAVSLVLFQSSPGTIFSFLSGFTAQLLTGMFLLAIWQIYRVRY